MSAFINIIHPEADFPAFKFKNRFSHKIFKYLNFSYTSDNMKSKNNKRVQ